MQIIIDVSEEEYDAIKAGHSVFLTAQRGGGKSLTIDLIKAVRNGTPLPKGHGDLIDANDIEYSYEYIEDFGHADIVYRKDIEKMTPLIEADKEGHNADRD